MASNAHQDLLTRLRKKYRIKTAISDLPWLMSYWRDRRTRRRDSSLASRHRFSASDVARMPLYYINLDRRKDRDAQVRFEFDRLGLSQAIRWSATPHAQGIIGCGLSHASLLHECHEQQFDAVIICEDDLEFLIDRKKFDALIVEFMNNDALDVLCIAYNSIKTPYAISRNLALTKTTQTSACYVVKHRALEPLSASAFLSVERLLAGGPVETYALDILWKSLQAGELRFAVPRSRVAHQRESFSDIQGTVVDYGL
jgi:hypothetical protein